MIVDAQSCIVTRSARGISNFGINFRSRPRESSRSALFPNRPWRLRNGLNFKIVLIRVACSCFCHVLIFWKIEVEGYLTTRVLSSPEPIAPPETLGISWINSHPTSHTKLVNYRDNYRLHLTLYMYVFICMYLQVCRVICP